MIIKSLSSIILYFNYLIWSFVRLWNYIYIIYIYILHNEELNDLYSSPNIVWVIKSRRMRWAGHVAHMGEERGVCKASWWGNLRERDHWRDLGVDGWILGWVSRRWDVAIWTGLDWPKDRDSWRTLVSAVMNLRVPWNAGNFLTSCKLVSFSRRTLHHGVSE